MPKLDAHLVKLATEASRSSLKWERVLEHIMGATGAPAAMITLRDKKHCQIVDDDALERDHHSPFICGFPIEVVTYYLNELRTIDPWAEAQIRHYPTRPTLMSRICPPERVEDQTFFNWLNQMEITDTLAFELDCMPHFWTACNIFLTKDTNVENLLSYACTHHDLLKSTWKTYQEITQSNQLSKASLEAFDLMDVPACIMDDRDCVIVSNRSFDRALSTEEIKVIGSMRKLSIGYDTEVISNSECDGANIVRHASVVKNFRINVTEFNPDPFYESKKTKFKLLIFQKVTGLGPGLFTKSDFERLTPREQKLVLAIRGGASVEEAGKILGYKRSMTYKIWGEVKETLSVASSHQVRAVKLDG